MEKGTVIRTILVIATCLNTALLSTDVTGFANPTLNVIYEVASVVLNFIIVACATWFNNDYTEEARMFTAGMRASKVTEDDDEADELPANYFEDGE